MLDFGLEGKLAVVAGAGAGIGGSVVDRLRQSGAIVTRIDIDPAVADIVVDARDKNDVNRAINDFDHIDVLVDVIGEARWGRTVEMSDADYDESFDLVLRPFFNLTRAAAPRMNSGSIVAIASVSGLRSAPLHGPYGAAKAGLMALVRTLAIELAAQGTRVNAVAPGAVRTPRVADRLTEASRDVIPLGRYAEPVDIANAVVFLASDLASYITGQTLVVDGGATAQFPLSLRA